MGPTATEMMKYFQWKLHDSWDFPRDYGGSETEARVPKFGDYKAGRWMQGVHHVMPSTVTRIWKRP